MILIKKELRQKLTLCCCCLLLLSYIFQLYDHLLLSSSPYLQVPSSSFQQQVQQLFCLWQGLYLKQKVVHWKRSKSHSTPPSKLREKGWVNVKHELFVNISIAIKEQITFHLSLFSSSKTIITLCSALKITNHGMEWQKKLRRNINENKDEAACHIIFLMLHAPKWSSSTMMMPHMLPGGIQ